MYLNVIFPLIMGFLLLYLNKRNPEKYENGKVFAIIFFLIAFLLILIGILEYFLTGFPSRFIMTFQNNSIQITPY